MIGADGSSTIVGSPDPNVSYAIRTPSRDATVPATSGSRARIAGSPQGLDEVANQEVDAHGLASIDDVAAAVDELEARVRDGVRQPDRLGQVADSLVRSL